MRSPRRGPSARSPDWLGGSPGIVADARPGKPMKTAALIGVLLALLGVTCYAAWSIWVELGEVELGFHGWLAMGLGIGLSVLVGVGLMVLVFYSNRRGYDR